MEWIGFLAFFTSCISLIPQILRTYKTKSVEDLSFLMLLNFLVCSVSWVVYGMMLNAFSIWLTNIFMSLSSLFLLILKCKYRVKT
jgi:MtN3 and saliva related transmembrane protein